MKLIYAGAPAFSVPPLRAVLAAGHTVAAVVTQPDKPAGRKAVLTPTPLKTFALENGIPVLDFARLRDHAADLSALGAPCMVTCAYGQILTEELLAAFPAGVYNVHASLLPRWRGASPIQHAILAGDAETGVTIMRTDVGLDTGDVLLARSLPIGGEDTAATLSEKLSRLGGECIAEALALLEEGRAVFTKQDDSRAMLCKKIKKEDCLVDFSRPAKQICNLIRAMDPAPLAYAYLRGGPVNLCAAAPCEGAAFGLEPAAPGTVVRADKAGVFVAAGEGFVRVLELQAAGGKRLRAADFVNGRKAASGDVFGGAAQ